MFTRATARPFTCLRCQYRQLVQDQLRERYNLTSTLTYGHRWQHTGVATVEDDDNDKVPIAEPIEHVQDARNDVVLSPSQESFRLASTRERNATRIRHWRPHQAEELGVDVLGRPAEVLILPTRKRKVARPIVEQHEDREKASLHKSLASESRPVSMKDILKNVDSLKAELGGDEQNLSTAQWNEHKQRLVEGFTNAQLQRYLHDGKDASIPNPKHTNLATRGVSKSITADKIMSKVWRWKITDMKKMKEEDEAMDPQPESTKKRIAISATKLNYIMQHEKQQLGQLSELFGVQIDIFKKKRKIQLSGTEISVKNASEKLSQLVKGFQEIKIAIPHQLQTLLTDESQARRLFAMLMQKHRLAIHKERDTLSVVGLTKACADVVLRDLLLLSGNFVDSIPYSIRIAKGQEVPLQVPFYTPDLPSSTLQDGIWYRYVSQDHMSYVKDGFDKFVSEAVAKMLKSEKSSQRSLSRFVVAPGSLSHEFSTDLGQALYALTSEIADKPLTVMPLGVKPLFVLQQGLLPQTLAGREFAPVNKAVQGIGTSGALPQPFALHLRLRPVSDDGLLPIFEIFLHGSDINRGLHQPLSAKQVFAVIDQQQHNLLLPDQPLDIKLIRQSRLNLLGVDSAKPPKAYLNVLGQIGSNLEQVQSSSKAEFPPVWRLNVSPLLKKKIHAPELGYKGSQIVKTIGSEAVSVEIASSPSTTGASDTTMYILEPPEYLDITSYASALAPERYINHIICDTDHIDKPRQRQILRISPTPLSDLLTDKYAMVKPEMTDTPEKQRWFEDSVTAAYNIAMRLRDAEGAVVKAGSFIETTGSVS